VGLVKQVLASLPVRSIQRLTRTFLTLSLSDIATNVGLGSAAAAEAEILRCAPLWGLRSVTQGLWS